MDNDSHTSQWESRKQEGLFLIPQLFHTRLLSSNQAFQSTEEKNKVKQGISVGTKEFQNLSTVVYKLYITAFCTTTHQLNIHRLTRETYLLQKKTNKGAERGEFGILSQIFTYSCNKRLLFFLPYFLNDHEWEIFVWCNQQGLWEKSSLLEAPQRKLLKK